MISIGGMDNQRLGRVLADMFPQLEGEAGFWKAQVDDYLLMVMTDETHDRMRIMIPVCPITEDQLDLAMVVLEANFDRALDAKYAAQDGWLFSIFMHPLKSLTVQEVENATSQVICLAKNTGTSFSSSELIFNSQDEESLED